MKPIAVFYHIKTSGGQPAIDPGFALSLFEEQMGLLRFTGLLSACSHFVVGLNGDGADEARIRGPLPEKASLVVHGAQARSELPTLGTLRQWLPGHEDWHVCYWHAKGVTHTRDAFHRQWRRCMESVVIDNWRRCVRDLDNGFDSAGAHWLTREVYGAQVNTPFWGGNMFWATAAFLLSLPAIPAQSAKREDDFIAENWIGMGKMPRVRDYKPHWPGTNTCNEVRSCFLVKA